MRKWRSHLVQTFQFASRSFFQMTWRQSSHLTHRPSVRTRFSAVASISLFSRLNQDIGKLPVAGGQLPVIHFETRLYRTLRIAMIAIITTIISNNAGVLTNIRFAPSIFDPALREHALFVGMLHLLHLGDRVGDLDDGRMRIASGQYYMYLFGFGLQCCHHLGRV